MNLYEDEFLHLAAVWLACRWQTMGGAVHTPWFVGPADLHFALLGVHDYHQEMRLLLKEWRESLAIR